MSHPIHRPSVLQAFLKEWGLYAKKSLSQNFLIDGNIIQKIVAAAAVTKEDVVIEIGPGPGALTEALLNQGAHVIAIEMDPLFAKALDRLQTPDHRLEIIQEDVLKVSIRKLLQERGITKCKVVANLPYHITTPILTTLLPLHELITSLTIMVQKEFAERMGAKKATPEYSSFTLFLEFYATVGCCFKVSRHCFSPSPNVDSSVVHCLLHPPLLKKEEEEEFFTLTRGSFGKRRKMLRSSLKELYGAENVEQALTKIGLKVTARPEELSLEQFIDLYQVLHNRTSPPK